MYFSSAQTTREAMRQQSGDFFDVLRSVFEQHPEEDFAISIFDEGNFGGLYIAQIVDLNYLPRQDPVYSLELEGYVQLKAFGEARELEPYSGIVSFDVDRQEFLLGSLEKSIYGGYYSNILLNPEIRPEI